MNEFVFGINGLSDYEAIKNKASSLNSAKNLRVKILMLLMKVKKALTA